MLDFFSKLKLQREKIPTDKRLVLVGGCFDLFHYGHLQFLKAAKDKGEYLLIALESDEFIEKFKKRKPIHDQQQRQEILEALKYVDYVIPLPLFTNNADYFKLVTIIAPQIIAVSENDPQLANKQKQAQAINAQLKIVTPHLKNFSSTAILNPLINSD